MVYLLGRTASDLFVGIVSSSGCYSPVQIAAETLEPDCLSDLRPSSYTGAVDALECRYRRTAYVEKSSRIHQFYAWIFGKRGDSGSCYNFHYAFSHIAPVRQAFSFFPGFKEKYISTMKIPFHA